MLSLCVCVHASCFGFSLRRVQYANGARQYASGRRAIDCAPQESEPTGALEMRSLTHSLECARMALACSHTNRRRLLGPPTGRAAAAAPPPPPLPLWVRGARGPRESARTSGGLIKCTRRRSFACNAQSLLHLKVRVRRWSLLVAASD